MNFGTEVCRLRHLWRIGFLMYIFPAAILLFMGCSTLVNVKHVSAPDSVRDTENLMPTDNKFAVLGTWWWWVDSRNRAKYLDFAAKNGINEIYYHTTNFSNQTAAVIEQARDKGIRVYYLEDDYNFIWDRKAFGRMMERYFAYQNSVPEKQKFAGLHLDIEPQEHPEFGKNAESFLQNYLDFIVWVCSAYKTNAVTVDLDIAWWFDDVLDYRGKKTELYKALINEADRVFVMSYKDTAAKIFDIAKEEISYAKRLHKQIVLGVETDRVDEEDDISYFGKDTAYFYGQLGELKNLVDYDNCGLAIHHISSWFKMVP